MGRVARQIDYQSLTSSELVWLAQVDKNQAAIDEIYSRVIAVAERISRNYCRRYTWIPCEDMSQSLLLELPRIIGRYRPGRSGTTWEKYVYFRLTFEAKDYLRREDPLGISYPQKKQYPEWHRLGDEAFSSFEITGRREMDADELDLLKLYESIDAWRAAFATPGPKRKIRVYESSEGVHPSAYVDGWFYGQVVFHSHGRKKAREVGMRSWIVNRFTCWGSKQLALKWLDC